MANTLERENYLSDFLKCPICLETFKRPKCLPCLHTFCEACLQVYIDSNNSSEATTTEDSKSKVVASSNQSGIKCPTCKKFIQIGEEDAKCTWLQGLPDNFFINSLIDKQLIQAESKTCDPCASNGKKELAQTWCANCSEALCQECQNDHQKFKALRNHSLLDLNSVKTQEKATSLSGFIPCTEHLASPAQVFCRDHHVACCTLCATVRHRTCSEISTLEEASKDVKNDKTTLDLQKQLDNLVDSLQKRISQRKDCLVNLKLSKETLENKTTGLINDAIKHLETLKTSFQNEMENKVEVLSANFDNEICKLTNLLSRVLHQKHTLSVSVSQGSNEECLVERENILRIKDEIGVESDEIPPDSQFGIFPFTVDPNFQNLTSNITAFRKISSSKGCMKNGKLILLKKEKLCTGVCSAVFHKNDLVIPWYEKKQVLVVDFSLNLKSSVNLNGNPRDITVDDLGRVFVSLPNEKEVLEVDMKTKSVKKLFSSVVKCYGILWMNDKFIITSGDIIESYRHDGIKQKEIPTKDTWHMCCKQNEETLLYPKADTVIENYQLSNEKSVFTQSGANLRGIDTDVEGNIYTVGMKSNKLYQLSPDGILLQEVNFKELFNLKSLWKVCLNDKNNIVVTTCNGDVALFEIVCTCKP